MERQDEIKWLEDALESQAINRNELLKRIAELEDTITAIRRHFLSRRNVRDPLKEIEQIIYEREEKP